MHLGPQAKTLESLWILNTLTLIILLQANPLQVKEFFMAPVLSHRLFYLILKATL